MGFPTTYADLAINETLSRTGIVASGNSTGAGGYSIGASIRAQLNVTAAAGTTPTLDVTVEDSVDAGANWTTIGTFTQKTATAREVINITSPFGDMLRVRWVVGGTTPSFNFTVIWFIQAPVSA